MLFNKLRSLVSRYTRIQFRKGELVFLNKEVDNSKVNSLMRKQEHLNYLGFEVQADAIHNDIVHVKRKTDKQDFFLSGKHFFLASV